MDGARLMMIGNMGSPGFEWHCGSYEWDGGRLFLQLWYDDGARDLPHRFGWWDASMLINLWEGPDL